MNIMEVIFEIRSKYRELTPSHNTVIWTKIINN